MCAGSGSVVRATSWPVSEIERIRQRLEHYEREITNHGASPGGDRRDLLTVFAAYDAAIERIDAATRAIRAALIIRLPLDPEDDSVDGDVLCLGCGGERWSGEPEDHGPLADGTACPVTVLEGSPDAPA